MARLWVIFIVIGLPLFASAENALKNHPSPYLELHGDDPVEWRDWGDAAMAEARRLNRPLFISSGYFACHWCHVMQKESFRNDRIAKLLNRHFVPVKLDRELHPAIDDHLIRFVERTRGQAGWPLNVFLTPDGYPIAGVTYLPPENFREVLERVAEGWQHQAARLSELARNAAEEATRNDTVADPGPLPGSDVVASALVAAVFAIADELGGGFGHQNKFPMEPQLLVLLELQARRPDERLAGFLRLTLTEMAARGLRDHLAGGFFRYTVDPDWRTPHFEKMLYNQALLIRVYLRAASVLHEPRFADVARDTLDFVLDDMSGTRGAFIAGLSAVDEQGEEGGAYLWDDVALTDILGEGELRLARSYWSLGNAASPDQGLLPQRLRTLPEAAQIAGLPDNVAARLVPTVRQKMLEARTQRRPPRDSKELTGWNGLLLWALADTVAVLPDPRYARAAREAAGFIRTMWDGDRLYRARDGLRVIGEASLEDSAYAAAGLLRWSQAGGDAESGELAREIAATAWDRYFEASKGWRADASGRLPAMPRDAAMQDGAMPAPSAVLMGVAHVMGIRRAFVDQALALSVNSVMDAPLWHATHAQLLAVAAED